MKLSKELEARVNFARFCIREKLDPLQLGELVALINKCANVGTRWCNGEVAREPYEKAMRKVEEKAVEVGLKVDGWPGLYPTVKGKDGFEVHIPL